MNIGRCSLTAVTVCASLLAVACGADAISIDVGITHDAVGSIAAPDRIDEVQSSTSDTADVTTTPTAALVVVSISTDVTGTVTALPPVGASLSPGDPLLEVDGRPVAVVLHGDVTMTRRLGAGIEPGADVLLLERNLIELGYVTADELEVDELWDDATTRAVSDWQQSLGVEVTGIVDVDDVVFVESDLVVTDHLVHVGDVAMGSAVAARTDVDEIMFELTTAQTVDASAQGARRDE